MDNLALLTDALPTALVLDTGREVKIDTRWHVQVDVADKMQDPMLPEDVKLRYLLRRVSCVDDLMADEAVDFVRKWQDFFACQDARLSERRKPSRKQGLDYWTDARLIISAFRQAYGIDLTEDEMHWWKFVSLLEGIPGNTRLGEVEAIRLEEPKQGASNGSANQKLREAQQRVSIVRRYAVVVRESFQSQLDKLDI